MEQTDKLERAIARIKQKYEEYDQRKKDRSIIVTSKIVEPKKVDTRNICRALTLSGKPCGFKASCGAYCRKHTRV